MGSSRRRRNEDRTMGVNRRSFIRYASLAAAGSVAGLRPFGALNSLAQTKECFSGRVHQGTSRSIGHPAITHAPKDFSGFLSPASMHSGWVGFENLAHIAWVWPDQILMPTVNQYSRGTQIPSFVEKLEWKALKSCRSDPSRSGSRFSARARVGP